MSRIHFLKKLSPAIVLLASVIASNVTSAQDISPLGVEWQCVQQNDELFHIQCIPRATGGSSVAPEAPGGIVKASLQDRAEMRLAAARAVEEEFFAQTRSVPLYVKPSDAVMVSRLLETVLCDTAQYCSVSYRIN